MPGNDHTHHARCGIFGRSPLALPVIGGRGSLVRPASITNVCSNEYHGPLTSGAGAVSVSWRTELRTRWRWAPNCTSVSMDLASETESGETSVLNVSLQARN